MKRRPVDPRERHVLSEKHWHEAHVRTMRRREDLRADAIRLTDSASQPMGCSRGIDPRARPRLPLSRYELRVAARMALDQGLKLFCPTPSAPSRKVEHRFRRRTNARRWSASCWRSSRRKLRHSDVLRATGRDGVRENDASRAMAGCAAQAVPARDPQRGDVSTGLFARSGPSAVWRTVEHGPVDVLGRQGCQSGAYAPHAAITDAVFWEDIGRSYRRRSPRRQRRRRRRTRGRQRFR